MFLDTNGRTFASDFPIQLYNSYRLKPPCQRSQLDWLLDLDLDRRKPVKRYILLFTEILNRVKVNINNHKIRLL